MAALWFRASLDFFIDLLKMGLQAESPREAKSQRFTRAAIRGSREPGSLQEEEEEED